MQPWMIERLKEKKKRESNKQIPLYLPLDPPRLTGSAEQDKEEIGTVVVDYTV